MLMSCSATAVFQPNPRANDPPPAALSKQAQANGVAGKKQSAASVAAAAAAAAPATAAPSPAPAVSSVSASFRAGSYENGLVTACNNSTYDEVMRRRLIGLPRVQYEIVSGITRHTMISTEMDALWGLT